MAFSDKEQQILDWAVQNGKSGAETRAEVFRFRTTGQSATERGDFVQPSQTQLEPQEGLLGEFATRRARIAEGEERQVLGQQTGAETLFQKAGETVGGAFDIAIAGIRAVTPDRVGEAVQERASELFPDFKDSPIGRALGFGVEEFEQLSPRAQDNVRAAMELIAVAPISRILQAPIKGALQDAKTFIRETIPSRSSFVPPGGGGGVGNVLKGRLGATVERLKVNVADKRAVEQAIQELPTETAKKAARNGIDINDINEVRSFFDDPITSATDKALFKEAADAAKAFSDSGGRGLDPAQIVGKPIVERLKTLKTQVNTLGKELTRVAEEELGNVTKLELVPAVLKRLQKVRGLQGLKLTKTGKLDFTDTSLASTLSKADQKAISEAFEQAVTAGSGVSKHRFRQELFEILGGKKKSLANITETQDRAFNALRQGLADVLESKSTTYKTLNTELAKILSTLSKGEKLLKLSTLAGEANVGLLELKAGTLARRLTSTSLSKADVEAFLRELDAVGITEGTSAVSTRNLQEFYNILNKYYEISPRTGFQGQIKEALGGGGGGAVDRVVKFVTGSASETPAVRQKALEDLLDELLD